MNVNEILRRKYNRCMGYWLFAVIGAILAGVVLVVGGLYFAWNSYVPSGIVSITFGICAFLLALLPWSEYKKSRELRDSL